MRGLKTAMDELAQNILGQSPALTLSLLAAADYRFATELLAPLNVTLSKLPPINLANSFCALLMPTSCTKFCAGQWLLPKN
ncbi:MAG: hypothetical protein LBK60_00460 [Verrucomicrobiales bacterium]|jgi:hypothetical protein|nr:hypothetical protein [Verrucomicrobiales bacterium]